MNEERKEDIAKRISRLGTIVNLEGKSVLEIGADWEGIAAHALVHAGAAEVVSTNMRPNWPLCQQDGKITKIRVDGRGLSKTFDLRRFDVVFGVAILEHIVGLDIFLEQVHAVLKPGGILYVHGGPLWTFAKGHHVWVTCDKTQYYFSGVNNPIGNWRHLVNDAASLASELKTSGVPSDHAGKIAEYVYSSDEINRVGYATMKSIFANSPLNTLDILEAAFSQPSAELAAAIQRGPYGNQERYDVSGLTFTLRRML